MSLFQIVTDSTADLPKSFLKDNNISCLNLAYTIKGVTYGKDKELEDKAFYDLMREGNMSQTSQVNPDEAKEALLKILENGNDVLYIAFSSGLSGTYNSGRLAAEEIKEERPESNIVVIDSKCASMGEGLLVYKAVKLREEGKSFEETCEWINSHLLNLVHLFTVDTLEYLWKGGRVSKGTAVIGNVLNIKPVLHVDDEGHLINVGKERGRKKSLLNLVDRMGEQLGSYDGKNDIFFLSHSDCLEDAEFVRDEVKKRYGIENCMISYIGPTIGSHTGPGTVALFFMGDVR